MFEIDTMRMFIPWHKISPDNIEHLKSITHNLCIHSNNSYSGNYNKFRLKYSSDKGVSITGSISNYFVGYEKQLDVLKIKAAIDKLSKELMLDLSEASLYRVDIALNLNAIDNTNLPDLFLELSKFKRLEQHNGVRFQTKKETFCIYDKSLELYEKRGINTSTKILRLEYRILKNLPSIFKQKNIKVKEIYEDKFITNLILRFYSKYNSIIKEKKSTIPSSMAFSDYLQLTGIKSLGLQKVLKIIDEKYANDLKSLPNKKSTYKYRDRQKVLKLIESSLEDSKRVDELDKEVLQAIQGFKSNILKKITQ